MTGIKMRPNRVYMHEDCLDVCISVHKSFYVKYHKAYSINATWINLGYTGSPWIIDGPRRFEITAPNKWRDITSLIHNPRTKPGLPK